MMLLLESGASNTVNELDQDDDCPLSYAYKFQCADSIQLLLDSDSEVMLTFDTYRLAPATFQIIVRALVDSRNRLQELALHSLPENVVQQLHIPGDRVLDAQTQNVFEALVDNGVHIPKPLRLLTFEGTVYHALDLKPEFADILFDAGFLDIDGLDSQGRSPMQYYLEMWMPMSYSDLETVHWLAHKGADFYQPSKGNSKVMVAHYAAAALGLHFNIASSGSRQNSFSEGFVSTLSREGSYLSELLPRVSARHVLDDCTCACSKDGCSPAVVFFRVLEGGIIWAPPRRRLEIVCGLLTEAIDPEQQVWEWLPVEAIRYITFSRMGLTHTCRRHFEPYEGDKQLPEDEIHEIHDEERLLIQQLDELVDEFEAKYMELGQPIV